MRSYAYYNEIDPYCCEWLRNLIAEGLIAPGDVDERDIREVQPDDLKGYTQCHFFAGIGGWSLALRLAGWGDARPVWTGSCPCQPFSAAGKQKGTKDDRHLWPEFYRLIAECSPPTVFGEQVASKLGREWLATVRLQMEALGYAVGAADLCAAGAGAPHIRQRLWFVGISDMHGCETGSEAAPAARHRCSSVTATRFARELANCQRAGLEVEREQPARDQCATAERSGATESRASPWSDCLWLPCTDGKQRPTQPGLFPLAHGVPARVAKLRGIGNAIVPQVAAAFVEATREILEAV